MNKFIKNNMQNIIIVFLVVVLTIVVANCVLSKGRTEMFKAYNCALNNIGERLDSHNNYEKKFENDYSASLSKRRETHHKQIRRPELINDDSVKEQYKYGSTMNVDRYTQ